MVGVRMKAVEMVEEVQATSVGAVDMEDMVLGGRIEVGVVQSSTMRVYGDRRVLGLIFQLLKLLLKWSMKLIDM